MYKKYTEWDWQKIRECRGKRICECENIAIEIIHPEAQRIERLEEENEHSLSDLWNYIYITGVLFLKRREGEEAENNIWINNGRNFSKFVENYKSTNLSSTDPMQDKNKENHIKRNNNHVTESKS